MKITRWMQSTGYDFRAAATCGVALAALVFLLPFMVYHFVQERPVHAFGNLVVISVFVACAWLAQRRYNYQSLTLFCLIPSSMILLVIMFLHIGLVAVVWCYPAILATYCMLTKRRAWIANVCILAIAVPIVVLNIELALAARIVATLVAVSVFSSILVAVIDEQQRQMREQLMRDPLTGVLNRVSLNDTLDSAIDQHREHREPTTLLAIDVDYFKQVNDSLGHDVGDRVLRDVATLISDLSGPENPAFRTGGEEFLVLLRNATLRDGQCNAELIRRAVEQKELIENRPLTVSVGVATCTDEDTRTLWTRRADRLLYSAKAAGRNCVRTELDWLQNKSPGVESEWLPEGIIDVPRSVNM